MSTRNLDFNYFCFEISKYLSPKALPTSLPIAIEQPIHFLFIHHTFYCILSQYDSIPIELWRHGSLTLLPGGFNYLSFFCLIIAEVLIGCVKEIWLTFIWEEVSDRENNLMALKKLFLNQKNLFLDQRKLWMIDKKIIILIM